MQLETSPQGLDAEVVLLIHHDADGLGGIDDHAAAGALGGVFTADQMALHQHLFVQRAQVVHAFDKRALAHGRFSGMRPSAVKAPGGVPPCGPAPDTRAPQDCGPAAHGC